MSSTRSFWLAVFIIGGMLLSMPSLGANSTSVESSPEIEASETLTKNQPADPSALPSRIALPAPKSIDNVSFGPITGHGTVDTDQNGKYDYFYINTSITVLVPGSYVALATLDFPNPDPSEQDHFPALFGMDEGAMFGGGGDGGIMPSFGQTTGTVNLAIFFRGDYINATGIVYGSLNVTGMAVLSIPSQPGPPGLAGVTGWFQGGGSTWQPSPYPFNYTTSPSRYYAYQFEPWISVMIDNWAHRFIDIGLKGYFEYLVFEVNVTGVILATAISNFRARVEVELETGAWSKNTTVVVNGPKQIIDVYFRSQELWNDPDFPNGGKFNVSRVEISRWKDGHWVTVFRQESEPGDVIYGTGPTLLSDWERRPLTAVIHKNTQKWNLTPIDSEPNGYYDRLQLDVQVNVSAYGFYTLYARFGMRDGYGLESEVGQWLEAGDLQNMSLMFWPQTLRSLPDIGPHTNVMWAGFQAYNKTELELRNGRGDHLDSWTSEFWHPWNNVSGDFDPITFMEASLPFTRSAFDHLVGDGRVATYMFDAATPFADVLNITLSYPWYADYQDEDGSPYEFEISIIDGNWSAIGPDWDARYEQEPIDDPSTYFYPLKRGGFYAYRWILVRVYMRLRENPLIPQNISITVDFAGIFDPTPPDPANNWFTIDTPVSDEFGFKISGHVEDPESGVLGARFWLEPDFYGCFAGTDPWWQYDNTAYHGSWDNRNVTEIYIDENGDFEFYAYPRGDSWSDTQTISMRVVNHALLTQTVHQITVTIPNELNPLPHEMILNGLNWLVAQQQADGSYMWSRQDERGHDDPSIPSVAFTAWAMLAFLQNGSRYDAFVVQACWNYIASQIQPDGSIQNPWVHAATYETAIALMGLIPLNISYAIHGASNPTLSNAILDAVDFLISIQNDDTWGYPVGDPLRGGWGYGYPYEQHWADLSNTQWVIIALAAARDYGVAAAQSSTVWILAEEFIRRCSVESGYWDGPTWVSEGYGFAYQPPGTGYSYAMNTMTAAGIWTLALMGHDDSDNNVSTALQWMSDHWSDYIRYDMGGEGYQYYALLSAAKALLLTGHTGGSQYGWMYASIDDFLNSQVIRDPTYTNQWFWDNTAGSEDPVYATLLAVLSQQIAHGVLGEVDYLSVTAESKVHLHVFGPKGTHYGYNYKTGQVEAEGDSTYSGLDSYPQQIIIKTPEKGIYTISVIPIEDGDVSITIMGETVTGETVAIRSLDITGASKGKEYTANITLTTLYGVNFFAEPFAALPAGATSLDITEYNTGGIDYLNNPNSLEIGPGSSFTIQMKVSVTSGPYTENTIAAAYVYSSDITLDKPTIDLGNFSAGSPSFEWNVSVSGSAISSNHTIWISVVAENTGAPMIIPCIVYVNSSIVTPPDYTIEVLQPNGGESISGSYMIMWNAAGPAGTSLSFDVEYSQDGGANWNMLISGVTAQQYSWDTTTVADGSNYLVRVKITGTTVSDASDSTFSIENEVSPPTTTTGDEEPSSEKEPSAGGPGFEVLAVLLGFVAVALFVRRRHR